MFTGFFFKFNFYFLNFVLRNGSVKFLGDPHWHKREGIFRKYSLPGTKVEGMYLEAIDASGTELMFEGFFFNLKIRKNKRKHFFTNF